ncbi:MAG: hypothetical protein K9N23_00405 [Akkermansiaceae bacterium]|nr:hypothetical protein [Akkermansiaceae bacterium]MCF7730110.1 hypothetical protein [Akkermansiaceae bacterium]
MEPTTRQRDRLLEILGLVFIVRDGAAVAVQFILARSPAGRIPLADDPVGEIQDFGPTVLARAVPSGIPELPADVSH